MTPYLARTNPGAPRRAVILERRTQSPVSLQNAPPR